MGTSLLPSMALGWLFVNAQQSFLTAGFLLSLPTLSLGSAWPPTHSAGVKAFASLTFVIKIPYFDSHLPHVQSYLSLLSSPELLARHLAEC